ncbi:MAG TPA: serine hydrolase [Steroidobacteraceae bacterium]|nr:serine hydrolase [Steroidobacteraceae bacterium]
MNRIFQKWPIATAALVFAGQCGSPCVAMGATGRIAATACRTFTQHQISEIGAAMQAVLQSEQKSFAMPSAGIGVFGCAGMLWVGASGYSDKDQHVSAGADTVFRAGSVTKPLTELVMMRLVDRGVLDLDAPVRRYLPDFAPKNPFQTPITLRMLATHSAGLIREPPLGSYFATTTPDLASVVRSLNDTQLLTRPGTVTKYSNAGVTVIGRVLEVVTGESYTELMRKELFTPAGMLSSSVRLADSVRPISYSEMTSYDAPRVPAPAFDMGLQPAGGLNTTLTDMASLGSALLAGGRTARGEEILSANSLGQMERTAQAGTDNGGRSYAVGFFLSDLQGHRLVSHEGAVYGFVSKFSLLPDDGIGAVAYSTLDSSSSAARMADYALQVALAIRDQKPVPVSPTSRPLSAEEARPLVGEYRHDRASVMVRWLDPNAFIETPRLAGRLRRAESGYVMDDYIVRMSLDIDPDGRWLEADGIRYTRVAARKPAPPAAEIVGLIGDYGWDHEVIRAFERDGSLFVRIEWIEYDRLARVTTNTWKFPPVSPFYTGEQLTFSRDASGRGTSVALNGIVFPRRNIIIDPPAGKLSQEDRTLLHRRALAASPPTETETHRAADLVSIYRIDPSIKLDVRYATDQNLLGFPVYSKSAAYLQRPAAEALARADKKLHAQGFGIVVFDGYRPWFVTKMFWDGTPAAAHVFVADPSAGSRHNRGEAVDISLVDIATGREVVMTGAYDEFSPRSYPLYEGGTSEQRWRRDLLRAALEGEGFSVYPFEWWHFDYADWRSYGLLNSEFSELPP